MRRFVSIGVRSRVHACCVLALTAMTACATGSSSMPAKGDATRGDVESDTAQDTTQGEFDASPDSGAPADTSIDVEDVAVDSGSSDALDASDATDDADACLDAACADAPDASADGASDAATDTTTDAVTDTASDAWTCAEAGVDAGASALAYKGVWSGPTISAPITVLWNEGSKAKAYAFGQGELAGTEYTVNISTDPPAAIVRTLGTGFVGFGRVMLLSPGAPVPDGPVVWSSFSPRIVAFSARHAVVYKAPACYPPSWFDRFPVGYSCGECVPRVPPSIFDTLSPVDCAQVTLDVVSLTSPTVCELT
jgi:hypothetical protein